MKKNPNIWFGIVFLLLVVVCIVIFIFEGNHSYLKTLTVREKVNDSTTGMIKKYDVIKDAKYTFEGNYDHQITFTIEEIGNSYIKVLTSEAMNASTRESYTINMDTTTTEFFVHRKEKLYLHTLTADGGAEYILEVQ